VTQRADCGTVDGWKRHQQMRNTICGKCAEARDKHLDSVSRMRNGKPPRQMQRWERAQDRLLTPVPPGYGLTEREWQVAVLAMQGASNKEIGEHLTIGVDTVKTHIQKILERLEVPSRTHLAILAYRRGWLPADLTDGECVTITRELFRALARVAHLSQHGRDAEARDLACRITPQLPRPRTQAPFPG
jgi:DNA-binding CsgD family transcriptional regulator